MEASGILAKEVPPDVVMNRDPRQRWPRMHKPCRGDNLERIMKIKVVWYKKENLKQNKEK